MSLISTRDKSSMFKLPPELQCHIYGYDPTYRQVYNMAMLELKELILLIRFVRVKSYDILVSEKECVKVLRGIRKEQLHRLAYFTRTRHPRTITKKRLLIKIMFNTCFYTRAPRFIFR